VVKQGDSQPLVLELWDGCQKCVGGGAPEATEFARRPRGFFGTGAAHAVSAVFAHRVFSPNAPPDTKPAQNPPARRTMAAALRPYLGADGAPLGRRAAAAPPALLSRPVPAAAAPPAVTLSEYREAFAYYDGNRDGRITRDEFVRILRAVGHAPTEAEMAALCKAVDRAFGGCESCCWGAAGVGGGARGGGRWLVPAPRGARQTDVSWTVSIARPTASWMGRAGAPNRRAATPSIPPPRSNTPHPARRRRACPLASPPSQR
jgi:hypothetical protein